MAAKCGCATSVHALVNALDRTVVNVATANMLLYDSIALAKESIPDVEEQCGVQLPAVRQAVDQVLPAVEDVTRVMEEYARALRAGQAAPAVRLNEAAEKATQQAQEALRTAETALDACTTDVCACGKAFLAVETVSEGTRTAAGAVDLEDLTELHGRLPDAMRAAATACDVSQPPGANLTVLGDALEELASIARSLTPGQRESLARRIADIEAKRAEEERLHGVRVEAEEAERMAREMGRRVGAVEAAERVRLARAQEEAAKQEETQKLERAMLMLFGPVRTFGQEIPAGFEEYLREARIPVTASGEDRSILDISGYDSEFTTAAENLGFTLDQLSALTAPEYLSLLDQVRAGTLTKERLQTMSIGDTKRLAAEHPRPPSPTESEARRRFREALEREGLTVVYRPGEVVARPRAGPGMEPFPAEIKREAPVAEVVKIEWPGGFQRTARRWADAKTTAMDALLDTELYLEESILECARRERLPTALAVAGLV